MSEKDSSDVPDVVSKLWRDYGVNSIAKLGARTDLSVDAISTGNLSIDIALGVGGFPLGRVVEIYGPESSGKSTLAMQVVAQAQKKGGLCAYIDTEHSMDPAYATNLGVDIEELFFSQPDSGEDALNITDRLAKSGEFSVIVVDSVAALVPKSEIAGEVGDSFVGVQSRMMSQALRKITNSLRGTNTIVVFINQLREKIGVMFGCFHYDARVVLADGSTEKIGKIVNSNLDVEVLSYNEYSGKIEPRRIIDWHNNGEAEQFIQVETSKGYGNGRSSFGATPNHMVFTPDGQRAVEELEICDQVLHLYHEPNWSDDQFQILLGSLVGDGSIRRLHSSQGAHIRFGHGSGQDEYICWKHNSLAGFVSRLTKNSAGGHSFSTVPSMGLVEYMPVGNKSGRSLPQKLIDAIDVRGMAILCLDDGSFSGSHAKWGHGKFEISCKSLDDWSRERLADRFNQLGLGRPTVTRRGRLLWSGERTKLLHEGIARFVPESMDYKLHQRLRGTFDWTPVKGAGRNEILVPQTVTAKYVKPSNRSMSKFDISVEGNHNYFVDGVLVHNSPETTPGGRALKFYSTVRLDVRRLAPSQKDRDKDGGAAFGNGVKVKVVKNKVAPPHRETEVKVIYGQGFSREDSLLTEGLNFGVLKQSGAYIYDMNGEQLGQGREKARVALIENPALAQEIYDAVMAAAVGYKGDASAS